MEIRVDGNRVLIAWNKRSPYTVVSENGPITEQYSPAGEAVWISTDELKPSEPELITELELHEVAS